MKRGSLQRPSQVREVTGAEWARMASPLLGLVGFVLRVDGQRIASLKFQVFGCPQLLAACAYVAEQLQDCELTSIDRLDTAELMLSLQIPTEKAGKILTLQDALIRCRRGLPVN